MISNAAQLPAHLELVAHVLQNSLEICSGLDDTYEARFAFMTVAGVYMKTRRVALVTALELLNKPFLGDAMCETPACTFFCGGVDGDLIRGEAEHARDAESGRNSIVHEMCVYVCIRNRSTVAESLEVVSRVSVYVKGASTLGEAIGIICGEQDTDLCAALSALLSGHTKSAPFEEIRLASDDIVRVWFRCLGWNSPAVLEHLFAVETEFLRFFTTYAQYASASLVPSVSSFLRDTAC